MCQAIRDGGRRCPIHRRDVLVALYVAGDRCDLPKDIVEDIFNELRREGRHLAVGGIGTNNYDRAIEDLETALQEWTQVAPDSPTLQRYKAILADRSSDEAPDGATLYALRRLQGATRSRTRAIANEIARIADENNMEMAAAARRWEELRRQVDTSRNSAVPAEYTAEAQRAAFDADLPSDRASVVAFAQLRAERVTEEEPRVVRESFAGRSSTLVEAGYDPEGGRLEVVLSSNPDTVYAWHSVPESVWQEMQSASRPMSVFSRQVRGVPEYMYASAEEAQADAYRSRCADCGQFAASAHVCPVRDGVAEPETPAVATPSVTEEAPAIAVQETSEAAATEPLANEEAAPEVSQPDSATAVGEDRASEEPVEAAAPYVPERTFAPRPENHYSLPDEAYPEEEVCRTALREFLTYVDENGRLVPGTQVGGSRDPVAVEGIDPNDSQRVLVREPEATFSLPESSDWRTQTSVFSRFSLGRNEVLNTPSDWDSIPGDHKILTMTRSGNRYFIADLGSPRDGVRTSSDWTQYEGTSRRVTTLYRAGYAPEWSADEEPTEAELAARTTLGTNATAQSIYSPRRVYFQSDDPAVREFSANLARRGEGHDSVRWVSVRDLRSTLRDGGIASGNVSWTFNPDYRTVGSQGGFIDTDGSWVPMPSLHQQFAVEGVLAVKKNDDDENVSVVSRRSELRCTCDVYRRNSDCAHVRYVVRHGGQLAKNMMTPAARARSSRSAVAEGDRFPRSIMDRSDFAVFSVPLAGASDAEERPMEQVGLFHRGRNARWVSQPIIQSLPAEVLSDPSLSDAERIHMADVIQSSASRWSGVRLPAISVLRSALRYGPVEISGERYSSLQFRDSLDPAAVAPTSLRSRARGRGGSEVRITGNIRIESDGEGGIRVSPGQRFRCSCGRFESEQNAGRPCVHTRLVAAAVENYVRTGGEEHTSAVAAATVALDELDGDTYITRARAALILGAADPSFDPDTPDGAEQIDALLAREEEEVREREAAERRRVEQAEQRRREAAARDAMSYAERAAEHRASVEAQRERYLARNPEFASARQTYLDSRKQAWETVEEGYGDNLDAVKADIAVAQAAKAQRQPALPVKAGDVTDGICDPNVPGSRRFGIEIEFDIPGGGTSRARQAIIDDMRAAGLTSQTSMYGYHGSARNGWREWSLEDDCTVAGELVSPLMADTPEHWEQLGKVLEIVRRHGGRPSVRAGAHVNVSTSSFLGSMAKHAELLRVMKENEDVLYRAAADPSRGTHRGGSYCTPNVETPRVEVHKSDPAELIAGLRVYSHGHGNMVNISHSGEMSEQARTEFRLWDSSLDVATIQQQVAISVALADYAERQVEERESSPAPTALPVSRGTYASRVHDNSVPDEALTQVAALADKIFRRQEDRKNFVSLFAINRWAS